MYCIVLYCIVYIHIYHSYSQLVIVPVNKASNNIGIICKRFYLHILNKEITESGNFEPFNTTSTYINREYNELLKKLGDEQRYAIHLPFIYWIPKFHKNPIGFRYITSGKYTYVNGMSKKRSACLKSLLEVAKKHSNYIHKYIITGSNKDIVNYMMASNLTGSFKDLKTYDFQTLYTKIQIIYIYIFFYAVYHPWLCHFCFHNQFFPISISASLIYI